jgi:hypothetical protein
LSMRTGDVLEFTNYSAEPMLLSFIEPRDAIDKMRCPSSTTRRRREPPTRSGSMWTAPGHGCPRSFRRDDRQAPARSSPAITDSSCGACHETCALPRTRSGRRASSRSSHEQPVSIAMAPRLTTCRQTHRSSSQMPRFRHTGRRPQPPSGTPSSERGHDRCSAS